MQKPAAFCILNGNGDVAILCDHGPSFPDGRFREFRLNPHSDSRTRQVLFFSMQELQRLRDHLNEIITQAAERAADDESFLACVNLGNRSLSERRDNEVRNARRYPHIEEQRKLLSYFGSRLT